MKIQFRWPPRPLGLGTPLNLALASPGTRSLLLRNWWLPLVAGVTASIAVLLVDQALFAGASLGRVREMGSQPLSTRLAIMILSAVEEELIYRVFIATLVAWLVCWPFRTSIVNPSNSHNGWESWWRHTCLDQPTFQVLQTLLILCSGRSPSMASPALC